MLDSLLDIRGLLSEKLTPATIHDANEAAKATALKQSAKRGKYTKFTPEQQAKVAKYTAMHRNIAVQHRFSKEFDTELKENTIPTWKTKFLAKVSLKKRSGKLDVPVTSLTTKSEGGY